MSSNNNALVLDLFPGAREVPVTIRFLQAFCAHWKEGSPRVVDAYACYVQVDAHLWLAVVGHGELRTSSGPNCFTVRSKIRVKHGSDLFKQMKAFTVAQNELKVAEELSNLGF